MPGACRASTRRPSVDWQAARNLSFRGSALSAVRPSAVIRHACASSAAVLSASLLLPGVLGACTSLPPAGSASVSGSITALGTQPVPPLRVCATPVAGGAPRCVDTPAGADGYRIAALPAGRYHLLAWNEAGQPRLLAHAETIRCIRAPCPADTLVAVEVAPGAALGGIDLNGAYAEVPAGWPLLP